MYLLINVHYFLILQQTEILIVYLYLNFYILFHVMLKKFPVKLLKISYRIYLFITRSRFWFKISNSSSVKVSICLHLTENSL